MIHSERVQRLNKQDLQDGKYTLYWMQASQRVVFNHALEYAIREANERNEPVVVLFGITDHFPEANERHYAFMLEGLAEVQEALHRRGIQFVLRHQSPELAAVVLARDASIIQHFNKVFDALMGDCLVLFTQDDRSSQISFFCTLD